MLRKIQTTIKPVTSRYYSSSKNRYLPDLGQRSEKTVAASSQYYTSVSQHDILKLLRESRDSLVREGACEGGGGGCEVVRLCLYPLNERNPILDKVLRANSQRFRLNKFSLIWSTFLPLCTVQVYFSVIS